MLAKAEQELTLLHYGGWKIERNWEERDRRDSCSAAVCRAPPSPSRTWFLQVAVYDGGNGTTTTGPLLLEAGDGIEVTLTVSNLALHFWCPVELIPTTTTAAADGTGHGDKKVEGFIC